MYDIRKLNDGLEEIEKGCDTVVHAVQQLSDAPAKQVLKYRNFTDLVKQKARDLRLALDSQRLAELQDTEVRLSDSSTSMTTFFNNILIGLGAGFLGFTFKDARLSEMQWDFPGLERIPTFALLSLIFMACSSFAGLLCSYNRILDFKHTHKISSLKKAYYANTGEFIAGDPVDMEKEKGRWKRWMAKVIRAWFCRPKEYILSLENNDPVKKAFDPVKEEGYVKNLKLLTRQLGYATRFLLKMQWCLFILALILFIVAYG
jgi:hypothetical protein